MMSRFCRAPLSLLALLFGMASRDAKSESVDSSEAAVFANVQAGDDHSPRLHSQYVRPPGTSGDWKEAAYVPSDVDAADDDLVRIDACCWVACYTRTEDDSIQAVGAYPLPGSYQEGICQPKGLEGEDLSQIAALSSYCAQLLPYICADGVCWAGGDTGGLKQAKSPLFWDPVTSQERPPLHGEATSSESGTPSE